MKKLLQICVPVLAISACTSDTYTHSGFQAPSDAGAIATSLTSSRRGSDINASGDGYAYAVGMKSGNGFYGYAGIVPTTTVSVPLSAGSATWSGSYKVARITGITLSGSFLQGTSYVNSGALTLRANFDTGTLIGNSTYLTVNGTFSGSNLSGNVTYRGLNGALTGLVGATGAVGAFHGNDATDIYAGGFMVGAP